MRPVQGEGERKHGGKRTPFCGLTVTFLISVSGRNEWMARKRIASRHGERAAILHLPVVAPEEFNGIDSHDHLVSRIRLPGNVGPAFLPRASQ